MKWNPFLSAIIASSYIAAIVLFMHFLESLRHDTPDTYIDGIGVISLFVFSVSVMAFLFFYYPVILLLEQRRAEAVSYFLKTLGIFGAITALILILVSLQA